MTDVGFVGGGEPEMVISTHQFSLNTWRHVGATWDGSTLSLYVDGQLEGARALSGTIQFSGDPLTIGRHNLAGRGFDGLIDEVEFFNRALSASEMQSIYDAGAAGKCKQSPNSPPTVAADEDPVVVDEGQAASNAGTVSDMDGDVVSLSASVGTVTNNGDGTWLWSFDTSDGPDESQTVTLDADDGNGGTAQTTFTLTVNNVAPTVTLSGPTSANEGETKSYSFTSSDPGDDTFSRTSQSCGANGTLSNSAFNSASGVGSFDCTFPDGPANSTVSVQVGDSDGDDGNVSTVAAVVTNVAPDVGAVTVPLDPIDINNQPVTGVSAPYTDPGHCGHPHLHSRLWRR